MGKDSPTSHIRLNLSLSFSLATTLRTSVSTCSKHLVQGHPWLSFRNQCIGWDDKLHLRVNSTMLLTLLKIKKQQKTLLTFRCSAHIYRSPVYHEAEVFHECLALSPPPFRPYNCVTVLTGAPFPTSRLYSFFKSERKAIDNWLTGRRHHSAIFEYLVLPFGLTIASAVFQDLVNDVLWDVISHFVFVDLDDILIFSRSL